MKNGKYNKLVLIIALVVSIILLAICGYIVYKRNQARNTADVVVIDGLSINYLSGRDFSFSDSKKEIKFSIINDTDSISSMDIVLKKVDILQKIEYELYENEDLIVEKTEAKGKKNIDVKKYETIEAASTKSYRLVIDNPKKETVKFKLDIKKSQEINNSLAKTILNDNKVLNNPKTKVGEISNTAEGLILDVDDSGNTYYFRGDIKNNYVKLKDKLYRVVKINGNGTVKLILDEEILSTSLYDDAHSKKETLTKYSDMTIYKTLNAWYDENLKDMDEYIAPYKFCYDINKTGDNLNSYLRINVNNNPTFNCLGEKTDSKIGILTADEVIYAGGTINESNLNFYLVNESITSPWWTLTPAKEEIFGIFFYEVNNGVLSSTSTGDSTKSLRPVINIRKDTMVTGKGTKENPYVIK